MRTILFTIGLAVFLTLVFGCGLIIPESVPDEYCEPWEALTIMVRAVQRGGFVPSEDMGDMRARARQYLVIVARNLACANWRKRQRLDLPGELPAVGVDMLAHLEARSSLRRVPMPAYLRPLLAALAGGDTIAEYARTRGILRATLYGRLRALRKKLRRK